MIDDAEVLRTQTNPHFMQSEAWSGFKSHSQWSVGSVPATQAGIETATFRRDVPEFGELLHLPRVSGLTPSNVSKFTRAIREQLGSAFAVKLETYQARDTELVAALHAEGWVGARATQYRFGVTAELGPDSEQTFARLKKRARTEVRQAAARGVVCRRVEDSALVRSQLIEMIHVMAERSGAFTRNDEYLHASWDAFTNRGQGAFYVAEVEGEVVSGAFVIEFGRNAFYKDGGSHRVASTLPVGRALQWHIIEDLTARGFEQYDLGNVPNPAEESASMSGLLTFKSGFSQEITEYMPAMELPISSDADRWRAVEPEITAGFRTNTGGSFY
ncbi:MAG: lipid II:glycine glycyltransferase FemX [Agromyces sp.]